MECYWWLMDTVNDLTPTRLSKEPVPDPINVLPKPWHLAALAPVHINHSRRFWRNHHWCVTKERKKEKHPSRETDETQQYIYEYINIVYMKIIMAFAGQKKYITVPPEQSIMISTPEAAKPVGHQWGQACYPPWRPTFFPNISGNLQL